jgi:hypothetical protein
MAENENWNTVKVPEKVEYEVEESNSPTTQSSSEELQINNSTEEKDPEELDGIQTKGAEKRIRQLVQQRKERDEQINVLIHKNEELAGIVNQKNNEVQEINKLTLDSSGKQLTDKIELARGAYLEAFEEGDKEKVLRAQEILNEAQADLRSVNSAKLDYQQLEARQPVRRPRPRPPARSADPKAEEWASTNEWFGKDNVMTAAALAIDAELKGEGYDPNDQDFYQEVDSRIKKAFPQRFGKDEERVQENETKTVSNTSTPAQVVSGSSRSSPNSKNKVKLSQEDVRLAQKWNIPLETYASEKLKVNKAEGDYTDVYTN